MTAIFRKSNEKIIDGLIKDLKTLKKGKDLIDWSRLYEIVDIPAANGMPRELKHTGAQTIIIRINGGDRKQEREFVNDNK